MSGMTRRTWLAAGSASAMVGVSARLGAGDGHTNQPTRKWEQVSPREVIRRRHLPNVELITQDGNSVHFVTEI